MRTLKSADRPRNMIGKFVSYLRSGGPWVDAHLPLIPVTLRSDRPALPNQRPIADVHQSGWRTTSESSPPSSVVIDWSDLLRGAS